MAIKQTKTTIQISEEVWNELNKRKERGKTYNDILIKLLNLKISKDE